MEFVKITDEGNWIAPIPTGITEEFKNQMIESILNDGYLPLEDEGEPDGATLTAIESYKRRYRQEEDHVVGYYEKIVDPVKVESEITRLKAELADSDYKVTKNHELQMLGLACEYDPTELHAQREPLREAIRELETYLA